MCIITSAALKSVFGKRCDGNRSLKYFTADDFSGLCAEPVEFLSFRGHTLRGAVYTHESISKPTALIVFSHGMFGGHLSYTTEINTFAKAGFAVLAFDNTGTFASDGDELFGFYQGSADLHAALNFVKSESRFENMKIVTVGHSWGGYSVLTNLSRNDPRVCAAVAFSAPESGYFAAAGMLGEKLSRFAPLLLPAFILRDGGHALLRSSKSVQRNKTAQILLLHGAEDKTVPARYAPVCSKALEKKENVTCILYEGKGHNVYQSLRSEKYMSDTFASISKARKKKKAMLYKGIDYSLMTEEDTEVMETVISFINASVSASDSAALSGAETH